MLEDELSTPSVRLGWRDDKCSASTSPGTDEIVQNVPEGFLAHRVTKMDTLAGIALKYNVQVADIKRFNGIISETAIYGHGTLLIPTQTFPVGEDVQHMFAQIAGSLGRDILNTGVEAAPVLHAARALQCESGMLPTSYGPYQYGGVPTADQPWWCRCGACIDDPEEDSICRRMASTHRGVEMVERSLDDALVPPCSTGPTRLNDNIRRRRVDAGLLSDEEDQASSDVYSEMLSRGVVGHHLPPKHRSAGSRPMASEAAAAFFSSLGKAIGETSSALVQKIKKVASQPAIAGSGSSSLADAADGVMSSLRSGLLPKGKLLTSRGDNSRVLASVSTPSSSLTSNIRQKEGKSD